MSKGRKQVAIGSLKVKLADLDGTKAKSAEVAALENDLLRRQIDAARGPTDITKAIRDALPKR